MALPAKFAPGALRAAGMGKLIKDLRIDFPGVGDFMKTHSLGYEFGNFFQFKVEADCPFLAASVFRKTVQDFRDSHPECDPSVSRVKSESDPFGCQSCEFPELVSGEGVEQTLNTDV